MKTHSQEFKDNISKLGRQLKSRITYTLNGDLIELGNAQLNSITPSYETSLLKSVMKYIEVDSNVEIPVGTIFKYELGLKIGNEYEYLNYGNYVVKEVENKEDTHSYLIKAYDKMLYAMKDYESFNTTYPITIRNYLIALCSYLGLAFANAEDEFVNYDKEIPNELFLNTQGESIGYTFRDVLDQLSEVTASNIVINNDDELEIRYINETQSKNLIYNKNQQQSREESGIQYTFNEDGTIDVSGTATGNYNMYLMSGDSKLVLPAGTYTLSGGINSYAWVRLQSGNTYIDTSSSQPSKTFTITETTNFNVVLRIRNGESVDGVFKPQLEKGTTATSYEPYGLDTIDETYLKNINVKFGKTFGPVNTITLTRAGGSDSIYNEDTESVAQNGRCEIKISENQFMNFNDRDTYIPAILEQLDGLEFSICDFDSTGVCYYEVGDKFAVAIGDTTYNCLMLNDSVEITQGLQESIYVDEPEDTNTDYTKSDKTDNKINQTYIIANKQEGEITALTSRVQTTEDELRNTYTIDQVNTLIQNAETGVTNTFSEAGGNNIFRNTGLWFENSGDDAELNPYEFWNGVVVRESEERASNLNALLLQDATLSQSEIVPNGNYTVSFKYKKLIALAEVKAVINDVEYELTEDEETEFIQNLAINSQQIKIDFISDTDNACEIYDLMVNAGSVKLAYSQNQNETTTDTVNISKGITITSSDTDTTFKANSDGIRTLDNNGNELAKFTDKGMTTKEMVVREKAQVVELLFQKVGDQIWISKL